MGYNLQGVAWEIKIDPTADMTVGSLSSYGNVNAGGSLVSSGDATIGAARAHVITTITNSQTDGFTSLYLNSTNTANGAESAHIFIGQNGGMSLITNTAHPIKLSANRFAGNTLPSIEIPATGNKNVVINSPLIIDLTLLC